MMECKHLHKQWQNLNYPVNILSLIIAFGLILAQTVYVTLKHWYICSNSQQYIAWVKMIK